MVEELDEDDASPATQKLSTAELEAEGAGMVAGFVGADVDPARPLTAQGLDSLAALELRQKLQVPAHACMPLQLPSRVEALFACARPASASPCLHARCSVSGAHGLGRQGLTASRIAATLRRTAWAWR